MVQAKVLIRPVLFPQRADNPTPKIAGHLACASETTEKREHGRGEDSHI